MLLQIPLMYGCMPRCSYLGRYVKLKRAFLAGGVEDIFCHYSKSIGAFVQIGISLSGRRGPVGPVAVVSFKLVAVLSAVFIAKFGRRVTKC
jgi:hypothetical protein